MKQVNGKRVFNFLLVILMATVLFWLQPTSLVKASSPADDSVPPETTAIPEEPITPENDNTGKHPVALGLIFQREKQNHERQEKLISKADKASEKISELIARAKENGKDTTELEKALSDFNAQLGKARLVYDRTGKLIQLHQGFDDTNKVTDSTLAKITVEEIRKGNKEVRDILGEALKNLRAAGQDYRKANPKPTTTSTVDPS
ncbi:hypothetical protein [Leptolinea tardivitalis]|uniref:Uncharacterized protein n=1 Tax=Leptolinea tardivitalis TaxID=229920 RepID=A0A0P6XTK3_9CHLR|nr:hypothetical protein [Leptolinea tardivitalis]KPL72789.1 hypothetical protein ADM99_06900 [Leptolinea tardivitalis]GAP20852.1 hypothetical protein LTAR_01050 [Leptolinea tardivitalis]